MLRAKISFWEKVEKLSGKWEDERKYAKVDKRQVRVQKTFQHTGEKLRRGAHRGKKLSVENQPRYKKQVIGN